MSERDAPPHPKNLFITVLVMLNRLVLWMKEEKKKECFFWEIFKWLF